MTTFGRTIRHFIVEEKDVLTVLSVINKHRKLYEYRIGNCGWKDKPTKWFITFDVPSKTYGKIVKDLLSIGKFNLDVSPNGVVDLTYEIG